MNPITNHDVARERFLALSGLSFKDVRLLEVAFTHRSYLNEAPTHPGNVAHNERLEFLGDAVLELAVTDALYALYRDADEGELTAYRAALVNASMLGSIAETLGVNECLLLSKGEARDTGRARSAILANAFEAVVGALYLDQGFAASEAFVEKHIMVRLDEVLKAGSYRDAKSQFQEFAQEKYGITPSYKTISSEGPDHARVFRVSVSVGDVALAEGEGQSKQEAEQSAAKKALEQKD
ncbi:MAG: ribonuclease III [Patescibacteria group bacterium]